MPNVQVKYSENALTVIQKEWHDCTKCKIGEYADHHVFWETFPKDATTVDFLFIGEGPGQEEDRKGLPFIGEAGKLLREAIDSLKIESLFCPNCKQNKYYGTPYCPVCFGEPYITYAFTNLLLCRPFKNTKSPKGTGNRAPEVQEVLNCMPRLGATIKAFNPEHIIFLGKEPYSYLPMLRDEWGIDPRNYAIANLMHPASILYKQTQEARDQAYQQLVQSLKTQFDFFWRRRIQNWENSAEYKQIVSDKAVPKEIKVKVRRTR